jgi:hypothetical protein
MMNPFTEVNWKPGLQEKRSFAKSLIIGFPSIAVFLSLVTWLARHAWKPFFLWLGVIGFAVGVVLWFLPAISKPFYLVWYFIACCMGIVIGNALFSIFYYVIFTPIGLVMRGKSNFSNKKGIDKAAATYWRDAEKAADVNRYYRQF